MKEEQFRKIIEDEIHGAVVWYMLWGLAGFAGFAIGFIIFSVWG